MEKVYNDKLKELYINKFKLNDIFTDNMSEYMELVLFKKVTISYAISRGFFLYTLANFIAPLY